MGHETVTPTSPQCLVDIMLTLTTTLNVADITVPMDSEMRAVTKQMIVNISILGNSIGWEVRGYVIEM